jgi:hypothetical protein
MNNACAHAEMDECPLKRVPAHYRHHEFLDEWLDELRRKRELREKLKAHVGGWAIISTLSGIGAAVYHGSLWIWEHLK